MTSEQVTDGDATESERFISTHDQLQADHNFLLATSFEKRMRERARISPRSFIFRAPKYFRDSKENLFDPKVVSIGPLHHGKEELQAMEKRKLDYLEVFLGRTRVSLQTLIEQIKGWESAIRDCYAEIFEFSSDDFVMMILVDSCFIIEIISRRYYNIRDDLLHMYHTDIVLDLLLVENQLPFFVLQGIYDLAFPNSRGTPDCFLNLCFPFVGSYSFINVYSELLKVEFMSQLQQSAIKNLLDLSRTLSRPSIPRESPQHNIVVEISIPKVSDLEEAGMVIKPRLDCPSLLDIRYTAGVLEIPQIRITDNTGCLLINLVVFEYCLYFGESYVCDYIQFMDSLVDTNKDVGILIRNGVFHNSDTSDNERMAVLFNNLRRCYNVTNYFYYGTQEKVKAYYKVLWHRWRASLRRDYCSSPWIIASTTAALILLFLTLVQAVCSIISVT